jgi:hypothetical protein
VKNLTVASVVVNEFSRPAYFSKFFRREKTETERSRFACKTVRSIPRHGRASTPGLVLVG